MSTEILSLISLLVGLVIPKVVETFINRNKAKSDIRSELANTLKTALEATEILQGQVEYWRQRALSCEDDEQRKNKD